MAAVKNRRYRPWTAAALATLRALYADTPTAHLARRLRRPIGTVYAKAAKLIERARAEVGANAEVSTQPHAQDTDETNSAASCGRCARP